MIKSKDLASVASKLQVPVIMSGLLHGEEPFTDDAEYALHEMISEMQPDSALLCIALCGTKLANGKGLSSPATRVLEMECRRVIEDYAVLWLRNAESGEVDEAQAFETLSGAQEDLEDLAGLLENCMSFLERRNGDAAILCEILSTQARAQALIAEAYFEALEGNVVIEPVIAQAAMASNVIPFPVKRA